MIDFDMERKVEDAASRILSDAEDSMGGRSEEFMAKALALAAVTARLRMWAKGQKNLTAMRVTDRVLADIMRPLEETAELELSVRYGSITDDVIKQRVRNRGWDIR